MVLGVSLKKRALAFPLFDPARQGWCLTRRVARPARDGRDAHVVLSKTINEDGARDGIVEYRTNNGLQCVTAFSLLLLERPRRLLCVTRFQKNPPRVYGQSFGKADATAVFVAYYNTGM